MLSASRCSDRWQLCCSASKDPTSPQPSTRQVQLPELTAAMVTDAESAFLTGLRVAAAGAGVLHLILGLAALRLLPRPPSCS